MMKSHGAIRNGVAAALLFATPAAFACSPVKAIGVYFERNATTSASALPQPSGDVRGRLRGAR
jgi:hypothetical protein